ncbi:MAG: maleylacetate reductase [Acidimicrobiales bacterium]
MAHGTGVVGTTGATIRTTADFERQVLSGRVVFGAGRVAALGAELGTLGLERALLISSTRRPGLAGHVRQHGGTRIAATWGEVRQHVPADLVERATACAQRADGLVCAGGGSTIGLAKALALRTGLPVVAIPTTYSGSEMTPVWGITEHGTKRTGRDPSVQASTVIYDPELMLDLPPSVECPSALNAFAHCAEALYAPRADPVTLLTAAEGARRIAGALRASAGEDRLARCTELALGAYLGGAAFASVGGSIHHALCHLLGGRYDLPHAETHAAVLPHVLSCIGPAIPDALSELGRALGVEATDVPGACWDQAAGVGCPTGLAALGLSRDAALRVAADLASRTEMVDREGAVTLLDAAWRGERPDTVAGAVADAVALP